MLFRTATMCLVVMGVVSAVTPVTAQTFVFRLGIVDDVGRAPIIQDLMLEAGSTLSFQIAAGGTTAGTLVAGSSETLVFRNVSETTYTISAVTLTNTENFFIVSDGCTAAELAPDDTCSIEVGFQASQNGTFAGELRLTAG